MPQHPPCPSSPDPEHGAGQFSVEFVSLLTGAQLSLFRYICGLVGDPNEANNILQETNLVLWRKADDFELDTSFDAWSRSVALWQVRAWLRDRGRDRHVFSSELVSQLARHPLASADMEPNRRALRSCVRELADSDRSLLRHRYCLNETIRDMAEQLEKTPSAIKSGLFRIRKALRHCIERRRAEGRS